ncbi:hypothetical protein ACFXO9_09735 [Nocardia tengchongensis]|uniref:hypothetical protein n=1 Tax=Nocardia tengchongensis TaxID=2055889 RepID=UPI0036B0A632
MISQLYAHTADEFDEALMRTGWWSVSFDVRSHGRPLLRGSVERGTQGCLSR